MPVGRALLGGSPYLGVYVRASDRLALAPPSLSPVLEGELRRLLGVDVVRTTVLDSEVVGALVALNSEGAIVGDSVGPREEAVIRARVPLTVVRVVQNALGNNVLANDHGALVHPELPERALDAIRSALKVPVRRGTLAGLGTVGMAGVATNQGVVVHPKATDREAEVAERVLGVPVHRSTANFGVPIVGACLVANSRAFLVGEPTTPVEFVHLQEGLKILA